jgi:hypothetical protein
VLPVFLLSRSGRLAIAMLTTRTQAYTADVLRVARSVTVSPEVALPNENGCENVTAFLAWRGLNRLRNDSGTSSVIVGVV